MTDRERLEAVAKGYHRLCELTAEKHKLTAQAIRACIGQLSSRDAKRRCDAVKYLGELADLLEG